MTIQQKHQQLADHLTQSGYAVIQDERGMWRIVTVTVCDVRDVLTSIKHRETRETPEIHRKIHIFGGVP